MADERLGASFSIDTTNLKAGLSQANRLIRESESQFKSAAAGLDDWSKSEDGINAKIKSLNSITEIQKTKVNALKSEYQRLINDGLDPASAEAVNLRTKINNEQAALNANEKELQKQKEALNDVGNETEKTGKGFSKLGDIAKGAAKIAAAAVAAAAAGVAAITKQAVSSYADYEQLVGGVDTLFGKASAEVQKKAANAYKTAGMSANEYMETVTGFSASLIQSLGGDTEKAAKYADMAITDMSDNANKMGTSIDSIQNAYSGFAKQNYTMLDNLKLGYGGTKQEMQRLLDDAEKVSGIKYDISSYADVVDAIHVVQTEMGITGTTAKEASQTISGSVSATKSAYENLLSGLADDNADMDMLVNNLVDSGLTAIDNIIPRVLTVLDTLPQVVEKILPKIPPIIEKLLPPLLEAATKIIQGIVGVLPQLISTLTGMLPDILSAILGMLPQILDAVITIIIELINALSGMLPTIVDAIMKILPVLINALIKAIPDLLQAAITLLMAIIDAIPTIIKALVKALPDIVSTIISTLLANLPQLIKAAIQLFMALIKAIPEINKEMTKALPSIIKGIVTGLKDGIPKLLEAGKDMLAGLFKGFIDIKAIKKQVKKLFDGIVGGLKSFFRIQSPSKVMENVIGKNLALGIGEGFKNNIKGVNDMITNAVDIPDPNFPNGNRPRGNRGVVVYQTNNYSQAHSRYEIYKSKQQTAAAVRLAMGTV